MALIEQLYPQEVKREIREFMDGGTLVIAANPGGGAAQLVTAVAPDSVVLHPREAGTPFGFGMQFAQALVDMCARRLPQNDAGTSMQPALVALLAVQFGRRAADVIALAEGKKEGNLTFAHLTEGVPERTVLVIDDAHLVDAVAGREALWGLRDRRRVVLITRPWFVDDLRHSGAAFFGHGRDISLASVPLRPPLDDPQDAAFVVERTAGSAELAAEVLQRGEGDVRRGWAEAVEARRSLAGAFLNAAFAIHPFGPRLIRAIAADEAPYAAIPDGSSARVAKALRALRDSDFIYPPRPRRWRLADAAMAVALLGAVP